MLAARLYEDDREFRIDEINRPDVGACEVLIEMKSASICGTDVDYYNDVGSDPATFPAQLGHEGAGVVVETGEEVNSVRVGDRVVPHYVLSCQKCTNCRRGLDNRCRHRQDIGYDGGGTFSEYISIPERNAFVFSDDIPFSWGSIVGCAVSTAYHAVKRSNIRKGDTVVIFGLGGVGLHAALWAEFFGASEVLGVDLADEKLQAAPEFGVDLPIHGKDSDVIELVREETDGFGADVAIECSGAPVAMEQAIESINGENPHEAGNVVSVGAQYDPVDVEYWDLREGWLTTSGDHTASDLEEIIELLEGGRINLSKSIDRKLPLERITDGIEAVNNGDAVGRVLLEFE